MKIGFLVLSILAMAATWWWATRRRLTPRSLSWRDKQRIVLQSLLAGVAVYFALLLGAGIYLALAS